MPAFFLLNNKRGEIAGLESTHGVQILILPDGRLRPDEYEFEMEGIKEQAKAPEEQALPDSHDAAEEASTAAKEPTRQAANDSADKQRNRRSGPARQRVGDSAV